MGSWNAIASTGAAAAHSTTLSTDWTVQRYWLTAKLFANRLFA